MGWVAPREDATEVITMRRRHLYVWLVAISLANLVMTCAARAQADAEPDEGQPAEADAEFRMTDEQFEQMILGKDLAAARKFLQSRLEWEITRTDQIYRLTPIQRKKLEIAGRGSLKRFFDRVAEAKERLHRAGGDFNRLGPVLQEFESFQQGQHAYLFGEDSMFAKTLKNTLTSAQIAARKKTIYRGRVEWMVSLLDKPLGLKAEQHRRFVSLIVEETSPLRRYGSFDYDAVMYQASRLPRDKVKPIFDDAQLAKLLIRFGQADRMETVLFGEGYLLAKPPGKASGPGTKDRSSQDTSGGQAGRGLLIGAGQARRN
jgi:hypothetical protein